MALPLTHSGNRSRSKYFLRVYYVFWCQGSRFLAEATTSLMVPLPGNATGNEEEEHLMLTVPRSPSGLRDTQVKLTSRYLQESLAFAGWRSGI